MVTSKDAVDAMVVFAAGDKSLRLGRYLCEQFLPEGGESDAELFYEKDPRKACNLFWERYVRD